MLQSTRNRSDTARRPPASPEPQESLEMYEAIKTMNDTQLRELISAIACAADPWCSDVMAMGIDAIDAIGDELFRRTLRSQHSVAAD